MLIGVTTPKTQLAGPVRGPDFRHVWEYSLPKLPLYGRHGRQRAGEARARDARRCWDEETLAQAAGADPVGALALLAALY